MNVLRVLPSIGAESGGPVRSTLANCRAIHSVAPEVRFTVATTTQGLEAAWQEEFEASMPADMRLRAFPAIGRHAFSFSPRLESWLWKNLTDFDLVILHALLHPVSSAAAWIARRRGVPYLIVPHGTLSRYTFEHRRTRLKRVYFKLVERHTLSGAAAVRFTSEAERAEAPVWDGSTVVRVIPHPYEPRYSLDPSIQKNPHQVLFLSRLDPMKGIDLLLDAFPAVRARIPDVRLVVAGSGGRRFERRLRSKIELMRLGQTVTLAGFVEGHQKARLLAESSVFVLPSHRENFGVAAVEAMDAGLPLLIARGVAIWPQVEKANAGIVIDDRSREALASGLVKLLCDCELRETMGRNGQRLVHAAFDPESVGRELWRLYRSIGVTRLSPQS